MHLYLLFHKLTYRGLIIIAVLKYIYHGLKKKSYLANMNMKAI